MIETTLVRRAAAYPQEIGLFGVDQYSDDDLKKLPIGGTIWAQLTNPKNKKLLALLWVLCGKLTDGGLYLDKEEAMADLKQRAKWAKRYRNHNGEWVIELKSLSTATGASLSRLADRIFYIVCTEILPHLKRGKLRKEIESMVDGRDAT